MRIVNVVGARPNMMKVAPIMEAMTSINRFEPILIHTGQHYDANMSQVFFEDLDLPQPDIYLGIGSSSHAVQTAKIMMAFEPILERHRPDLVLVVGDVNSTLACTLVASKLHIPVAHVEAGLRSFNRYMPEEINRIVTDALSQYLFTTDRQANENLKREGIVSEKIYFVGNVMIDTLLKHRQRALKSDVLNQFGLSPDQYALLTLHRPSNVDNREILGTLLQALGQLSERIPILFPAHPRTRKRFQEFNLENQLDQYPNLLSTQPLGYLDFLNAMANAKFIMSDSGGIQEEATALGIPCLTLRKETERPITVTEGTNLVIGNDPDRLSRESERILAGQGKAGRVPELWDGQAAQRIIQVLVRELT